MRLIIFMQLFIAFLSSCVSDKSQSDQFAAKEEIVHVNNRVDSIVPALALSFDTSEFLSNINLFIPTIAQIDQPFYCSIVDKSNDVICDEYVQFKNSLDPFVCFKGLGYKNYFFSTNCKHKFYKEFWIRAYSSKSKNDLDIIFDIMNNPNLYGPVLLPNTQNYVIKTTTNVYWMNSRAYYPYQNFLKIVRFFESAINEQELVDSINATLGPYRTLNR
jgi:hypothetical protein